MRREKIPWGYHIGTAAFLTAVFNVFAVDWLVQTGVSYSAAANAVLNGPGRFTVTPAAFLAFQKMAELLWRSTSAEVAINKEKKK